jgi:hypothetical protein
MSASDERGLTTANRETTSEMGNAGVDVTAVPHSEPTVVSQMRLARRRAIGLRDHRVDAIDLAAAVDGKRPDELVFSMPGGTVMRLSNWRRVTFVPARARAGSATGSAFTTFGTPPRR